MLYEHRTLLAGIAAVALLLPTLAFAQLNEGSVLGEGSVLNEGGVLDDSTSGAEHTPSANVYTLNEALDDAARLAPTVDIARSEVEEAILRRLEVRMERSPTFQLTAGIGPGPHSDREGILSVVGGVTVAAGTTITVPITTFGKIRTGSELAQVGIDVEEIEAETAELEARYEALRAYSAMQWYREASGVLEEAHERMAQAEEMLLDALDDGDPTARSSLRQLDLVRADFTALSGEAREAGFLAQQGLELILGVAADTELEPFDQSPSVDDAPTWDDIMAAARTHRPDLRRVELGLRARELELQLGRRMARPDFFFITSGQVTWSPYYEDGVPTADSSSSSFNELTGALGVGLRWKINPGTHSASVRRLSQRVDTMAITANAADTAAELEVREAWLQATNAVELVQATERAQRSAEAWLNQTAFQFEQGFVGFEELVDPLKEYYRRTATHLEAVLRLRLRIANLALKTGSSDLTDWPSAQ